MLEILDLDARVRVGELAAARELDEQIRAGALEQQPATADDLLAEALLRLERIGYRVVLHVHDEIIAEVPAGFGSTTEFSKLMITPPRWALTLPIAANAWSGPRFSKS